MVRRVDQIHPESKTFPTTCEYCGTSIFYYENENGSRVFFDELGTWWKHECYDRVDRGLRPRRLAKSWTGLPVRRMKTDEARPVPPQQQHPGDKKVSARTKKKQKKRKSNRNKDAPLNIAIETEFVDNTTETHNKEDQSQTADKKWPKLTLKGKKFIVIRGRIQKKKD